MNRPTISPDEASPAFTLRVRDLPDGTVECVAESHPEIRAVAADRQLAMSAVEGALRKLIFKQ
jgi:hypothetical protein